MEDKFIIYAPRRKDKARLWISTGVYDELMALKQQTDIPVSTLAEQAIRYALERAEIHWAEPGEEAEA